MRWRPLSATAGCSQQAARVSTVRREGSSMRDVPAVDSGDGEERAAGCAGPDQATPAETFAMCSNGRGTRPGGVPLRWSFAAVVAGMVSVAIALMAAPAEAANKSWGNAAGDGQWNNPANWRPSGTPAPGDAVNLSTNDPVTLAGAPASVA